MNKEDLKRLSSGVKNVKYLFKGWFKTFMGHKLSPEEKKKISVCLDCEYCTDDIWFEPAKDEGLEECSGAMCSDCLCPIMQLVISEKPCPKKKW